MPLALLGERTRGRRQTFALGERALERGEPRARERQRLGELLALLRRRRRARGRVGCGAPELGAVGERLLRGRQPRAQPGDRLEPERQPLARRCAGGRARRSTPRACPLRRSAPPRPRSARASSASSRSLTWRRASPAAVRRSSPSASRPPSASRSSCAIRARSDAISPTSFSARSAAVACSASGRSRFLTSASTSRARSAWIATRCELQLGAVALALEAPEPRGLLDHLAPPLGRRRQDLLDLALPDDRVHPAAEPDVGEQLDEVDAPDARAVDEVLALAAAVQAPRDRELRELESAQAPSSLSKSSSTSQ